MDPDERISIEEALEHEWVRVGGTARKQSVQSLVQDSIISLKKVCVFLHIINTAIFVWIDGFSFSALIGNKIFGKIPRISIESGKDFAEDFPFLDGIFTSENHFSNHFSMGSHSTK